MKRKGLILFVFVSLAFTAILSSWMTVRPKQRINDDTIKLINHGMSLNEVETVFGVPPGDYTTDSNIRYICPPTPPYRTRLNVNEAIIWISDDAQAIIHFDDDGLVEGVFTGLRFPLNGTTWDKFRRWLGI